MLEPDSSGIELKAGEASADPKSNSTCGSARMNQENTGISRTGRFTAQRFEEIGSGREVVPNRRGGASTGISARRGKIQIGFDVYAHDNWNALQDRTLFSQGYRFAANWLTKAERLAWIQNLREFCADLKRLAS